MTAAETTAAATPPLPMRVKNAATRPDLLIYLTDGCGTAPDEAPSYPVMWVLTANGNAPAAWGKHLFLKNSQTR